MKGETVVTQSGAMAWCDSSVEMSTNAEGGLLGGEGFVLQKFTGNGLLLAEIDGSVVEIDLKEGEQIKVETGHVALFEASVGYDVEAIKGLKNIFFGGQGLFLTTLTGPDKVWLQILTAQDMAQKLIPFMLTSNSSVSVNGSNSNSNK